MDATILNNIIKPVKFEPKKINKSTKFNEKQETSQSSD